MTPQRILGLVVLVVGIALLVTGFNASESLTDQFTRTFTGHASDRTTWYIVGGIALSIIGLAAEFIKFRGRRLT